jgi:5-methylcytosine-specific restriction enzyme A
MNSESESDHRGRLEPPISPKLIAPSFQMAPVPSHGPLTFGDTYRRRDLHARFGGNRFKGIAVSQAQNAVLLFHTAEPSQQFYRDGYDEDGIYWYCGEGTSGDMRWTSGNRAIRDHVNDGRDLFLFERVQRRDGLWKLTGLMHCAGYKTEPRNDRMGESRIAIIFGLIPLAFGESPDLSDEIAASSLNELRRRAVTVQATDAPVSRESVRTVYQRCAAVREYVLRRADGVCEACSAPAPFLGIDGRPFLEAHHIDKLSDAGLDRIDRVGAVCPNCHRRCHYGADAADYNRRLLNKVRDVEVSHGLHS